MAVEDYYRKIKKPVKLPGRLQALSVGDYIRADIATTFPIKTKRCLDNAVHFNRLGLDESEFGLSVLISPMSRRRTRNPVRSEVRFWCHSEAYRDSSFLQMAESASDADVILTPDNEKPDPIWIKKVSERSTWRGWSSESGPVMMPSVEPISKTAPRVGVVITVYNKPDRFVPCLKSIEENTIYPLMNEDVFVMDDGSDKYSKERISSFPFRHIFHPNMGYLKTVNRGVDTAFAAGCDLVVIVNSDVLVTRGWLSAMVRCNLRTGAQLVNPMCNQQAAISLPLADEKSWGFPRLPGRTNYIQAALYASLMPPNYPDAVTNVGQCMLIDKPAWIDHGPFDGDIYGNGYGEECELWARVRSKFGRCAVADDAYVYHESHGTHETGSDQQEVGAKLFISRWRELYGKEAVKIKTWHQKCRPLRSVALTSKPDGCPVRFVAFNIGPYGGVYCVLRLVDELVKRGLNASVEHCIKQEHTFKMLAGPNPHRDATSMRRLGKDPNTAEGVIVATHWFTGELVRDMLNREESFVPMAFWQDREDWFTEKSGKPSLRKSSIELYPTIPNRVVNADWVGRTAKSDLGIDSYTHIPVGVDVERFHPSSKPVNPSQVRVLGMYRPSTPRRGGKRLQAIYEGLREKYGKRLSLETFGEPCTFGDVNYGALSQDQVAVVMRSIDIVVEPSEYQGFGLPGLEALSSGVALATTDNRGIDEYGVHRHNCLIEKDGSTLAENICELIEDAELRRTLGGAGRQSALRFSWDRIGDRWFSEIGRVYNSSEFSKYGGSF